MNRRRSLYVISIAAVIATAAVVAYSATVPKPDEVRVTITCPESAGKPIPVLVSKGTQFTISLVSNMTTGYSWKLAGKLNSKTLSGSTPEGTYISPKRATDNDSDPPMVGASGMQEWTFTAVGPGIQTLVFNYARPWEKGVAPIKTQTIKVIVN